MDNEKAARDLVSAIEQSVMQGAQEDAEIEARRALDAAERRGHEAAAQWHEAEANICELHTGKSAFEKGVNHRMAANAIRYLGESDDDKG